MALGSECPKLLHNLKVIETMPEEMTTRSVYDLDADRADRMGIDKLSKELYEVLVMITEGEAKMMIRSVPDQDGSWLGTGCTATTIGKRWPEFCESTVERCVQNRRLTLGI